MEVNGQLISAPDPLTCPDRKHKEQMAALQERRRGLQMLLSTRLAELRRICLQEAELTGAVPRDFPLEAGEEPPCVRRRRGTSRQGNRKCRAEEEDSQRSKAKKTLFSGALRKHSDPEHNTHTHHGKRTVHRGCHTDDTVRSESSSTDSTGLENDDGVSQSRPRLVSAGSPVEVFFQNKTSRSSLHISFWRISKKRHRTRFLIRLHDSSSSSGPSDTGPAGEDGVRFKAARHSNSSDALLDHITPREEMGGLLVRGTNTAGAFRSSETLTDGQTRVRTSNGLTEGGGGGRGRGGGYSEVLLDYVWGKQQQLQQQQSQPKSRHPITSNHQLLFNGYSSQQPLGAPPTYCSHLGDQRRIKVSRTKSCGPFLPVQQGQADTHNSPLSGIQPDPHPHLLPPRPPQLPPAQDAQLEEATRSLHKALALEGLRDWYLRNTIGSTHQNAANGKVNAGVNTKVNGVVKGQAGGGGALQSRRRTHGVIQQSTYQTETSHHHNLQHHKNTLPHSATFHGHPLHGRSMDSSLYHDSFLPQTQEDQPSPGTLV
ncbi:uncharacterized protein ccdc120a [Lycodopsis pacificus]